MPISDSAGRSGDRRSASHASPRKTRSLCKRIFIIAACIAACLHGIAMKTASVSCDKFGCARQSGFGLSVSELGPSTAISGVESGCALMDHDFPGTACSSCDSTCSMISGVETSPPQVSDNAHWIKFADNHFRIDSLHWIGRQIVVRTCEDVADKFEMTPGKNGACVQWNSFFSICRNFLKRPLRLLLPIVAVNFVHGGGMLGLLVPIAIVVVNEMIDCKSSPPEPLLSNLNVIPIHHGHRVLHRTDRTRSDFRQAEDARTCIFERSAHNVETYWTLEEQTLAAEELQICRSGNSHDTALQTHRGGCCICIRWVRILNHHRQPFPFDRPLLLPSSLRHDHSRAFTGASRVCEVSDTSHPLSLRMPLPGTALVYRGTNVRSISLGSGDG